MTPFLEIPLWPGRAPGSEALSLVEQLEERSPDPAAFKDRAITGIAAPRLVVFRPQQPNGLTIVVVPGGGYQRVVWDKEGIDVARWLCDLGVTVCLLVYRLPGEGHARAATVPLQDAQRAVRLARVHAAKWDGDPARVGAMGFSAGGHVVATLSTAYDRGVYAAQDTADAHSARPDFSVLIYPVVSMDADIAHMGSRQRLLGDTPDAAMVAAYSAENCVTAETPECFMALPDDDAAVPPENAVRYYLALREAGIKAEMHIFRQGGHGFGIRLATGPVGAWTALCESWLRHRGWLPQ